MPSHPVYVMHAEKYSIMEEKIFQLLKLISSVKLDIKFCFIKNVFFCFVFLATLCCASAQKKISKETMPISKVIQP